LGVLGKRRVPSFLVPLVQRPDSGHADAHREPKPQKICGGHTMTRQNHDGQLSSSIDLREAEIVKIANSKEEVTSLREHLREITEGKSFKGSHRSAQFLSYIVNQAIAGHFDSLKERVIGIELFGRSPSYDTGEDAIVRVTATDVRKRLLQHYGEIGTSSRFRLSLPLGSYIPEITRVGNGHGSTSAFAATSHAPVIISRESSVPPSTSVPLPGEQAAGGQGHSDPDSNPVLRLSLKWRPWLTFAILLLVLNLSVWGYLRSRAGRVQAKTVPVLPWSALLSSSHSTHLITSDPNIVFVQEITGSEISLPDYANHKYIPEPNKLTANELRLCRNFLWGDNSAASVDPPIAVRIGALAQSSYKSIDARAARSIQLSDLKTDDNFIFLGSPRSDPWSALFADQLDFRFVFDKSAGQEIIRNVHPRLRELPAYVPTALGWGTGRSYAIIAFVRNPDQNGQVLLLAGADGEGTEAAGKLVTDFSRLSAVLMQCGIRPAGPPQHFELLLGLNTMAGSPNNVDIVACHLLPGYTGH
jgi:hypothetical protein